MTERPLAPANTLLPLPPLGQWYAYEFDLEPDEGFHMDLDGSYKFPTGLYEMDRFFCPFFLFPLPPQPPLFRTVMNVERPSGIPTSPTASQSVGIQKEGSVKQYTTFQYGAIGGTLSFAGGGSNQAGTGKGAEATPFLVALESKGPNVSLNLRLQVRFEGDVSYRIVDQGDFWCSSGFRDLNPSLLAVGPQGFTALGLHKEWTLKRGMAAILSVGANMAYNVSFTGPSGQEWIAKGSESPGGADVMLCSNEAGTWRFKGDGFLATSSAWAWADLVVLDFPPERFDWLPCEQWL